MQSFQERRTAEALELKRQQEAFMDMTSHETRNPLSAISLCVENISSTLQKILARSEEHDLITREMLESTLESAETIMACVAHQKCIIDDVLTLSKLGSGLLVVSPVEIQPVEELKRALNLFEGELHQAAIDLEYVIDPSLHELRIDWVLLDPTRLLQILINLLTNAIKCECSMRTVLRNIHADLH
jgi:signal transduction histidine kinase